jgi:hypothetical protein
MFLVLSLSSHVLEKSWSARLEGAVSRAASPIGTDVNNAASAAVAVAANGGVIKDVAISLPAEAFVELTGQTGSYMYMAPEVFREERYNEKVCRHSNIPNA